MSNSNGEIPSVAPGASGQAFAPASEGSPFAPLGPEPTGAQPGYRPRYRLATVLFLLTFFTTTTLGGVLYLVTRTDEATTLYPFLHPTTIQEVWSTPALLRLGLSFSLPLLAILGSHELGHFLACRRYGVPATVPYFLPAPLVLGTFGAFIRIRGRIRTKAELFDIGIAGPLAGFVVLLPFLVLGVAWSAPGIAEVATDPSQTQAILYRPGTSLAIEGLTRLFHGRLPDHMVLDLHPFALAAWVGLFATALNLLPMGQLDGGHLLYAVAGRLHRRLAWPIWLGVCALGLLWEGWLVLCFMVLIVMGLRHPPVVDADRPLDPFRRRLALVALALLVVCFTPIPLSYLPLRGATGVLVTLPG
ncbi:MAG TPA: site-2 protease family protein [Thermoanaerobaculia bacterium]|nr:site-2 protease family protein [Thermoanaerobaculia bacterium]